jgi:hypothetical protein
MHVGGMHNPDAEEGMLNKKKKKKKKSAHEAR